MGRITVTMITALTLLALFPFSGIAKKGEGFPGKGEGAVKSNAPSTGTQVKGQERALEVGEGEKKGLKKEETKVVKKKQHTHTPDQAPVQTQSR